MSARKTDLAGYAQTLDRKSRERLEKLEKNWEEEPIFGGDKLTLHDLRLLLEYFAPLQNLVAAVARQTRPDAPEAEPEQPQLPPPEPAQEQAQEPVADSMEPPFAPEALTTPPPTPTPEQMLRALYTERQRSQRLESDLARCQNELQHLQRQCLHAQQAAAAASAAEAAARAAAARVPHPRPEPGWLHARPELAQRLGLQTLPEQDTEALIRIVAVLAQRDNLERLWDALQERCDASGRPAEAEEQGLLTAALTWFNYNWQSRPYRLIDARPGTPYDFDQHRRSGSTPTGDTVDELMLPGIADGAGKPVRKALVRTRR